jgi:ketosteroid isomerase-like protein
MSEEKIEIVRRIYDEWGRGNFRVGAELFDSNTLLVLAPEFPESGAYRGPEEIDGYMRGFLGAWDDLVIKGESFIAAGDSVIVGVYQQGTGKESGVPVELRYFQVWSFRGDTVLRMENIAERAQAFQAAGVSEPG